MGASSVYITAEPTLEMAQTAILDQLVVVSLLLGVHLCFKLKEGANKPVGWILFASNLLWFFNSLLSFFSTNVTTDPQEAQNLFIARYIITITNTYLVRF
jgi:hypothetical protein